MLISGKPHKPGVRAGTPQQERELLRDLARKAETGVDRRADGEHG